MATYDGYGNEIGTFDVVADAEATKDSSGNYVPPESWNLENDKLAYYQKYGTMNGYVVGKGTETDLFNNPDRFTYDTTTTGTDTGTGTGTGTDTGTDTGTTTAGSTELAQVVSGTTVGDTQMNVSDYAGQIAVDPQLAFTDEMILADSVPDITDEQIASGEMADAEPLGATPYATTSTVDEVALAAQVDPREAVGYDAATTYDQVSQIDMEAAQGTVSQQAQIVAPQIDIDATARGENEVGKALQASAILDLNDVDSRATLKGQINILQDEFVDDEGNPIVPSWASGLARQVSRIAAFKGMTGTAATEAMSNALLEASISIAEQDAKFFQTVTLTNLTNKQQTTINRANVLAQMDMANLDARTTAAVENAKNFMAMDLANLNNEQQARLINTQQRFQSILEDAKAINAARLFEADAANEMAKFYDELNAAIDQYNAGQINAMAQFNANELNETSQFNATLEDSREKFYREMQYNIDLANAEWRQSIVELETQMAFEAAAFDTKNMVDVSQEALNRIWDRSDALLDYIWKSTENQLDRDSAISIAKIQADSDKYQADSDDTGFMDILGAVAGALAGDLLG